MQTSRAIKVLTVLFFLTLGITIGLVLYLLKVPTLRAISLGALVAISGVVIVSANSLQNRLILLGFYIGQLIETLLPDPLIWAGMNQKAAHILAIWVGTAVAIASLFAAGPLMQLIKRRK